MRSKGANNVCKETDYDVLWKFSWVKREVWYVREEGKTIKSWKSDRINRLDGELLENGRTARVSKGSGTRERRKIKQYVGLEIKTSAAVQVGHNM